MLIEPEKVLYEDLREYQKRCYDALENARKPFHSLVCIPTGGGKTRLAVSYLIDKILSSNGKVIWITHAQYLLNQAYDTFACYLKSDWMEKYVLLAHSGKHVDKYGNNDRVVGKLEDLSENHRIVICSYKSLEKRSVPWKDILGEKTTIVIDEAHHVVAEHYRGVIEEFANGKNLMGLTATPIRTRYDESNELYKIFKDNLPVKVNLLELLAKKYLVNPLFETVDYGSDETEIQDINNLEQLEQFLVENDTEYNQRIVEKYISQKEKYGKTVIFAINKKHVDTLYEAFCSNEEIDSEKVYRLYSNLSDKDEEFKKFKETEDAILINVNMLNEGVDVPDIKTVFMTKPLNSRIIVTQVIGRALRTAKGKRCAYIVNFAVTKLGKKLLLEMPKTAYQWYQAEFEGDKAGDDFEAIEEKNETMKEKVEEAKKKRATYSFSDVFLVGNYTITEGEETDIPIYVSFKEYRMIERYRENLKLGKIGKFPKRFFFFDGEAKSLQEYFNRENENVIIEFKEFDEQLFEQVDSLMKDVTEKIRKLYQKKAQREEYQNMFVSKYQEIKNNEDASLLFRMGQMGIKSEKDFIYFMQQELPLIKKIIKE